MSYSIGEAAKAAGVSKSTLSRAIKNGRISATRLDDGSYSIEPVELHRVYPPQPHATVALANDDAPRNTHEKAYATGVLEVQLDAVREQLRDRDDTISDLRRRLDQADTERREAQARVVGLLSDQRPSKGFWGRLLGR
jgi:excisionase family DNA binding protein